MKKATVLAVGLAVATSLASGSALAAGDAGKGEKVFKKCVACHTIKKGDKNKVGPNLFAVVGRTAGTVDGFKYSKGFLMAAEKIGSWEEGEIFEYLADPTKFLQKVAGSKKARSKMTFKLKKEDQRNDVIAFLKANQ